MEKINPFLGSVLEEDCILGGRESSTMVAEVGVAFVPWDAGTRECSWWRQL